VVQVADVSVLKLGFGWVLLHHPEKLVLSVTQISDLLQTHSVFT
jgi:hypothetical protein